MMAQVHGTRTLDHWAPRFASKGLMGTPFWCPECGRQSVGMLPGLENESEPLQCIGCGCVFYITLVHSGELYDTTNRKASGPSSEGPHRRHPWGEETTQD